MLAPTYPGIKEDEVHLHEAEDHLQQWINSDQDMMAGRIERYLKERAEFQANVDHRPQAEGYTTIHNYRNL